MVERSMYVREQSTVEDRMKAALELVKGITDEYDDLAGDDS